MKVSLLANRSVMSAVVAALIFTTSVHAATKIERPVDPFASVPADEKLGFLERDRGMRYLARVAAYDAQQRMPLNYSIGHLLDAVRVYEPKFGDMVESTPLALLNSSLYILAQSYRKHLPVEFKGEMLDSPEHIEMRELTKSAARIVMAAVATLPDIPQKVEMEFARQRTKSTPHQLLSSYLTAGLTSDGRKQETLFGGELDADFRTQLAAIEKRESFTSRFVRKVRSTFGARSCRDAFL